MTEAALKLLEVQKTKSQFVIEDMKGKSYPVKSLIALMWNRPDLVAKSNNYKVIDDTLWFIRPRISWKGGYQHKTGKFNKHVLAKRINGRVFGNSSEIYAKTRGDVPGRDYVRELDCQDKISKYVPMIPFELFETLKLDINALKIHDQGPEEDFDFGRRNKETGEIIYQHFTGSMLFSIGGHHYMFDVDRNEVALKNFNCWMSKLRKPCKTIAEAYASLKPDEVVIAERFLKREVPRQGEWFFIPVHGKKIPPLTAEKQGNTFVEANLQSKGNRAHIASRKCGEYVSGTVRHGGYEHKDLDLGKEWYKPVPNAAVESFKITGLVD